MEAGTRQLQGLGINDAFEASQEPNRNDMSKLNQVVQVRASASKLENVADEFYSQNFHTKAALIILHSRVELAPAYNKGNKRLNKWVSPILISAANFLIME